MGLIPAQKNIEWKIVRTAYNYPSPAGDVNQFVWLRRAVISDTGEVVEYIGEEQCVGFSPDRYGEWMATTPEVLLPADASAQEVARFNLRCMYGFLNYLFLNGGLEVK